MKKQKLKFILSIFLCISLLLPQIITPVYAYGSTTGGTVGGDVYGDGDDTVGDDVYGGGDDDTVGGGVYGGGLAGLEILSTVTTAVYDGAWYLDNPGAAAFTISTAGELRYLAELVNGTAVDGEGAAISSVNFIGKNITLADNIVLTEEWTPIGINSTTSFRGAFDGGNKIVSGLTITGSADYRGLFGYVSDMTIKNLTVAGAVYGGSYVGGIAGYVSGGTLTGCVNNAAVTGTDNVGGIAGQASYGNIERNSNSGTVEGQTNVGGIVGRKISTWVLNCSNFGPVEGASAAGSIIGQAEEAAIQYCFSYVPGDGNPLCGGGAAITNSYFLAAENSEYGRTAEAFQYGEIAYLLDGGPGAHRNAWTQGTDYPVLSGDGTDSYYRLLLGQPAAPYVQGTVALADLPADSGYKLFDGPAGQRYTYVPDGTSLELNVQRTAGYDGYQLIFIPAGAVTATEGNYEVKIDGGNVNLEYKFLQPAASSVTWYIGQTSPYAVATEADLLGLAQLVNGTAVDGSGNPLARDTLAGKTVNLQGNITVAGDWTPIGDYDTNSANQFQGTFDGQNNTIDYELGSALNPVSQDYQGLFGRTSGAAIKNLTVNGQVYGGGEYTGGIVGYAYGTSSAKGIIDNCTNSGNVIGVDRVGGVAGYVRYSTVTNVTNTGAVQGAGDDTGGIAGYLFSGTSVTAATNAGSVAGSSSVGGIAGYSSSSTTTVTGNSNSNEGTVTGTGDYVGGIVGSAAGAVSDSVNEGTVEGTGDYVGGIAGEASAVSNSVNEGTVEGAGDYVGGIAGNADSASGAVSGNENKESVTGGGQYTGGIVGYAKGTLSDNSNTGIVTGAAGSSDTGGIAGCTTRSIENCLNAGGVSGAENTGGIVGNFAGTGTYLVKDCSSSTEATVTGTANVGGIAGYAAGTLQNNTNHAAVNGSTNTGGVAGYTAGTLQGNTNHAAVNGSTNTGGIVGDASALVEICLNDSDATVEGEANAGGIAGHSSGIVRNCYNLAVMTGDTAVGGILGLAADENTKITGCFSYNPSQRNTGLYGGGTPAVTNSCYLADENSAYGRTEDAFLYSEAAWLVDGGEGVRSNVWTQGENYPVFIASGTNGPMYKLALIQPAAPYSAGSVTFGDLPAGDPSYAHCRFSSDTDGATYIYLPAGLPVTLNVQKNPGYTAYAPSFRPAREVSENEGVYTAALNNRNVNLTYEFAAPGQGGPGSAAWYNGGAGNAEGKFLLSTEEDLKYLAALVNGTAPDGSGGYITDSFEGKTVELAGNISLSGIWTAIGAGDKPFKGVFAGNSHTINGLYVDSPNGGQGLFGYTSGGEIKDLMVIGSVYSDGDSVGGIAGSASGTALTNCTFGSAGQPGAVTGGGKAGGIAGNATGAINNCVNNGTVNGNGDNTGGIAGSATGAINSCINNGTVSGNGSNAGGIAGNATGAINSCINNGTVAAAAGYAGGIAGKAAGALSGCANEGAVTGPVYIGGIVGNATNTITDCANHSPGVITGSGVTVDQYVGGIAGNATGAITGCTNAGPVSGNKNYIGGIAGYTKSTVSNSVNEGAVGGASYIGGISGYTENKTDGCANAGPIAGSNQYVGGIIGCTNNGRDMQNSVNTGTVSCDGTAEEQYVGGVAGAYSGPITGCTNTGDVTGTQNYVGGIAGEFTSTSSKMITKCGNSGAVAGANYVGGITGHAREKIENCYNLGGITATSGDDTGGIAGYAERDIWSSFSYSAGAVGLCGRDSRQPYQSYYYAEEDGNPAAKNAAAFKYGEVAYLLDAGKSSGNKAWTQGEDYPVLKSADTPGPVYKITLAEQAGSTTAAGSVSFAPPAAGSPYKIFTDGDSHEYTYLPAGTATISYEAPLDVTFNSGYECRLIFSPEGIVNITDGDDGSVSYTAAVPEAPAGDAITLLYSFFAPPPGDIAWHTADPNAAEFTIDTYEELIGLTELVRGKRLDETPIAGGAVSFAGQTIHLGADIEIASAFVPVGTPDKPFRGVFDGHDYAVSGLALDTMDAYQGLFGYTSGGEIKNLTVTGNIKSSGNYIGGIIGYAEYTAVTACRTAADAANSRVKGEDNVGGLVGYADGAVLTGCANGAVVNGSKYIGGITGRAQEITITGCTNEAAVRGSSYTGYTGGITGRAQEATITGCTNSAAVSGSKYIGGITGELTGIDNQITGCANTGAVTGTDSFVGGMAGVTSASSKISDCLNQGTVSATNSLAGGIAGQLSGTVTRCGNTGDITANSPAGGIAGANRGTINHSYNLGQITGISSFAHAGGISGENSTDEATVRYCYSMGSRSGSSLSMGAITGGLTDEEEDTISDNHNYANNINCYYCSEAWTRTPVDSDYAVAKSEKDFIDGEVAYLLDGGAESLRKGLWSQYRRTTGGETEGYPVLADESNPVVYKAAILQPADGSLALSPSYSYFNAGDTVSVTASPDSGYMLREVTIRAGHYEVDCTKTGNVFTFTMPDDDIEISAEFVAGQEGATHTVTFDANGGLFEGPPSAGTYEATVTAGGTVAPPPAPPVYAGMVLIGWYTRAGGGEKYDFTLSVTGPLTLYAHWKEEGKMIVTFDANGGQVEGDSTYVQTIDAGGTVAEPAAPSRDGSEIISYAFDGWFTQRSGGTKWDFDTPVTDDLTLYAHWTATNNLTAGASSAGSPFVINSANVLEELRYLVATGDSFEGRFFALGGDLELPAGWTGIGPRYASAFQGTFEGNGYTVTLNGAPLFGYIGAKAEIKDLNLTGSLDVTEDNTGAAARYNYGTISGVDSNVDFSENNRENIGGIAGYSKGSVLDCTNHGTVWGSKNVGGIVGSGDSTSSKKHIENCANNGQIRVTAGADGRIEGVGGIVGGVMYHHTDGIDLENCVNSADLTLTAAPSDYINYVGGIIGSCERSVHITQCQNTGAITVTGGRETGNSGIGGLLGRTSGDTTTIQDCWNTGDITAASVRYVGGLGGNLSGCSGSGAYNTGDITGKEQVGGLVGSMNGTFTQCFSTGNVTAVEGWASGLIGRCSNGVQNPGGALVNCYSTGNVSGTTGASGLMRSSSSSEYGKIINCYWYGESITGDEVCGISNTINEYHANNYYGLKTADPDANPEGAGLFAAAEGGGLTDPNDVDSNDESGSSKYMEPDQFASGEVAWLLDAGNEGTAEAPKTWTQNDESGYPELGSPTYYKISTPGSVNNIKIKGTVEFTNPAREKYNQGNAETPIYAAAGTQNITVSATPPPSETKDGVTYTYTLEKIMVAQKGEEVDITDTRQFILNGDAVVTAIFAEDTEEEKEEEEEEDNNDDEDDNNNEDNTGAPGDNDQPGDGDDTGDGDGTGDGTGLDDGTGTGEGGVIDDGSSAGQSGRSDETASAPAANGADIITPLIIARQADETAVEENTAEQEVDEGSSPSGGSPDAGGEAAEVKEEDEEEVHLTVFEIVKDAVQNNPLTMALLSVVILGILSSAGYRRYKKHMGDM